MSQLEVAQLVVKNQEIGGHGMALFALLELMTALLQLAARLECLVLREELVQIPMQ